MSWVQRMKLLGTGAWLKSPARHLVTETIATATGVNDEGRGRWWKLPGRDSVKETVASEVYDEGRKICEVDWDRIVLFNGKWYFPPVTVKPRFEAWDYEKLQTEPKLIANLKAATFVPKGKNLVLVALGVLGVVGMVYFLRWQNRKRFQAKVANAAAESVRDAVDQAVQGAVAQAFQSAIYQEAIGQALQNAAQNDIGHARNDPSLTYVLNAASAQDTVDVRDALVLALQDAVFKAALCKAVRDTIASLRTSDLTTEEVLKAHLDAKGLKEIDLGTLLDVLELKVSLPELDDHVLNVEDVMSSSVEELVGYGVPQGEAVKLRNAVMYLMDLHKPALF